MKIEIGKKYRDEVQRVYEIEKAPEGVAFPLIARRLPSRVGFSLTGDGEALGISGRVFMLVAEVADKMPHFYPSTFYRVKPRSIRFRVADLGHAGRPAAAFDEREAFTIENSPGFVRWLTDWQEISA